MNKIEKLIQELCPEGVRHFTLDELFDLRNGYTPSKANSEYWTDGSVPWFRMEDIRKNGRVLDHSIQKVSQSSVKGGRYFEADSLIIATTATIGEHALVKVPFLANQQFTVLTIRPSFRTKYDAKFGFYIGFLLSRYCEENTNISGFASVDMEKFRKFKFPLPPLGVQQEIVSILDKFTELEAELEAELEGRSSMFEALRTKLFDEASTVSKVELGSLCELYSGEFVKKDRQGDDFLYPVFNGGSEPTGFYSEFNSPENSIVIASRGSIGSVSFVLSPFWAGNSCFVLRSPVQEVNYRYLYHYLKHSESDLYKLRAVGTIPALNLRPLLKFEVPIPDLQHQVRVSSILDKFENLESGTKVGLPAEIQARRKQYEYYRNKILTFKELDVA